MSSTRLKRSLRVTLLGLGINTVLAVGKLVAGVVGHSNALIADAVESMADVFSSVVVWRAVVVAEAPPDEDHPYGHGKAEPLAGAVVSVMLLASAVAIAARSMREILTPQRGPEAFTLAVLFAVVSIKEGMFRFAAREAGHLESQAVRSDAWHHRSDAITSLAAAIGITIALVGGHGYEAADSVAAIVAAIIIAWNGWRLLAPSLNELMDTSPDRSLNARIKEIASSISNVHAVEKCLVRKMGYQYFVDMHVEVEPTMTVKEAHFIAHAVKDLVRSKLPQVSDVLVHIEPRK